MKLNTKAVAGSCALLWGGAVLSVGLVNMIRPRYGQYFLRTVASIYPGYRARPTMRDVMVGTACALADGAVGGALYALLYNRFVPDSEIGTTNRLVQPESASVPARPAV